MILEFRELVGALGGLGIEHDKPVIVHASLSSFGPLRGAAGGLLDALLYRFDTLVMPGFTYKTMVVPEAGPADNGISYGRGLNAIAEFSRPDMPVDRMIGVLPEALRQHPKAVRSMHPILSFVGVNAQPALDEQTIDEPLEPIGVLAQQDGWVLLMGVSHAANTSIHYAERLAGRKQFIRWALTVDGVVACPGFPGCSYGFESIAPRLAETTRWAQAGRAQIYAVPLKSVIGVTKDWIEKDPQALLCSQPDCERCQAVKKSTS